MALATWWRGDSMPQLSQTQHLSISPTTDTTMLAQLANLPVTEVARRLHEGHQPYVAWANDQPVAYGWVATQMAHIGELEVTLALPDTDRYLWDFATLPAWRGQGIYPRLLQAIVKAEANTKTVARFWIIAAPENRASSAGIAKAGFTNIAHLSFQRQGAPGLVPMDASGRVRAGATLLKVPVIEAASQQTLSPCWHCVIDGREAGRTDAEPACWPEPLTDASENALALIQCQCA